MNKLILDSNGKIILNPGGVVFVKLPDDTTPPTAELSNTPASRISSTSVEITVGGLDVVYYKYSVDGGAYSSEIPNSTSIVLSGLSEASHTLNVIGRDLAGNWQVTPTSCSWIVDLTPPVAVLSGTPSNPTEATTVDITVSGMT